MRQQRHPMSVSAIVVVALLAIALGLAACGQQLPSDPPGITGTVTDFAAGDGRPAWILVEAPNGQATGSVADKARVSIPPTTQFFGADGKPAPLDAVAAIKKGTRVRVWFDGAVAESYPVQGSSKAVQLLAP